MYEYFVLFQVVKNRKDYEDRAIILSERKISSGADIQTLEDGYAKSEHAEGCIVKNFILLSHTEPTAENDSTVNT